MGAPFGMPERERESERERERERESARAREREREREREGGRETLFGNSVHKRSRQMSCVL